MQKLICHSTTHQTACSWSAGECMQGATAMLPRAITAKKTFTPIGECKESLVSSKRKNTQQSCSHGLRGVTGCTISGQDRLTAAENTSNLILP